MMDRHPRWEARLVALVRKKMAVSYDWSRQDCLIWSGLVIKAVTGEDHVSAHLGKYDSFASAYAYLKTLGHDSPEAILDSLLDVKPVGFAHRGDLVMADDGIPMLCMGGLALSVGSEGNREGLVRVPREHWVKAWAVGEHHSSWERSE